MPGIATMTERNSKNFTQWRNDSGWRRSLSSWIWHTISLNKPPYLGWEIGADDMPHFIMLEHVRGPEGSDVESHEMRIAFDDVSQGLFYNRDWTKYGSPFVAPGETYWSGWWFQFKEDAEKFQESYGGVGSWQDGYKEWETKCREKREKPDES